MNKTTKQPNSNGASLQNGNSLLIIITVALLITGNLVGAGILGLPVNTGIDGLVPSLVAMLIFGSAMFYSAIVLSKEAVETHEATFNYPSLYHKYTGPIGKWIAISANMLILYGLLTAYLTGGATIICKILNINPSYTWLIILLVFLILTLFAISGEMIIQKYNILLMLLLWVSFGIIVFMGERFVEPIRLQHSDWGFLPVAIPIIVTSFHFHNIIPNICHSLKWDMKAITKAMIIGMAIGFIMNALWIQVGIGMLPLANSDNSLIYSYINNIPASVPMAKVVNSKYFTLFSMLFALLAIITSYVANGLGLTGFNNDLMHNIFKFNNKIVVIIITFLPPLVVALLFPNIFLKAINIVGGIGIVILFGVLPTIIAFIKAKTKRSKALAIIILLLFAAVFITQILEETSIIKFQPTHEQVKNNIKR